MVGECRDSRTGLARRSAGVFQFGQLLDEHGGVHGAQMSVNPLAGWRNKKRGRQSLNLETRYGLAAAQYNRKSDTQPSYEGPDLAGGKLFKIDTDDHGTGVVGLVERLQLGHFQQTGRTPACPEVDDYPPATEISELYRSIIQVRQCEVDALRLNRMSQRQ